MGLQRFPMSDFRGGLNTKDGPFALEDNEAQDLMNTSLSRRGILDQRAGKVRFDDASFPGGTNRAEHMRNWYPTGGTRRLYLSINGDIYRMSTAGALTSVFDGTSGTTWHFEQALNSAGVDTLWALNGVDAAKKIDTAGTVSNWAGTPPLGTMMRLWRNLMVVSGVAATPQRIFLSNIGDPETPITAYGTRWKDIKTTEDDLDPVTWLEVLGDYLVIFKKQSTWVITDETTFAARRLGSPGCEDRFQSSVLDGRAYFVHRSGIWSTEGIRTPRYESDKVEPTWQGNVSYANIAKCRVMTSRDRRLLVAWPFGAVSANNRILEFIPDLQANRTDDPGAWTMHDLPVASFCTFRPVDTDMILGGDSGAAKLHRLFSGTNDDGAAIAAWWTTGWRSYISEEPYERLRRLNMVMSGQLQLDVYQDFSLSSKYSKLLVVPPDADSTWDGPAGWDDLATWDPANTTAFVRAEPEQRGRYHAFRFYNDALDETFSVYAVEAAIRGGKEH